MNISGTLNIFRVFRDPSLCLPHCSISNFNQLPVPLSKAFAKSHGEKNPDIKAVVLDKDNCFAKPHANEVYSPYRAKFQQLRDAYPGARLLIVSNTAGTDSSRYSHEAKLLEKNTGVKVLQHGTKKPGCSAEVLRYFRGDPDLRITAPSQIVVVGDRIFTDVMMANLMGSRSVWIKDGVTSELGLFAKLEHRLVHFLSRRGYVPPDPKNDFV